MHYQLYKINQGAYPAAYSDEYQEYGQPDGNSICCGGTGQYAEIKGKDRQERNHTDNIQDIQDSADSLTQCVSIKCNSYGMTDN